MNQLCVFALIKELKEKAKKTERTNRVRITVFSCMNCLNNASKWWKVLERVRRFLTTLVTTVKDHSPPDYSSVSTSFSSVS